MPELERFVCLLTSQTELDLWFRLNQSDQDFFLFYTKRTKAPVSYRLESLSLRKTGDPRLKTLEEREGTCVFLL